MLLTEETDHAFSQGLSAAGCLQHLAEHGSQSHYDGHCAEYLPYRFEYLP